MGEMACGIQSVFSFLQRAFRNSSPEVGDESSSTTLHVPSYLSSQEIKAKTKPHES